MVVDGTRTDHQVLGNLRVSPALYYQAQHLYLTTRQSRRRGRRFSGWRSRRLLCLRRWGHGHRFLCREGLL